MESEAKQGVLTVFAILTVSLSILVSAGYAEDGGLRSYGDVYDPFYDSQARTRQYEQYQEREQRDGIEDQLNRIEQQGREIERLQRQENMLRQMERLQDRK